MRLLVDIGNTRLKSAIAYEGTLQALPSVAWREFPIEHWMDTVWREALADIKPDSVLVSNVAGSELLPALDDWCCKRWHYKPIVISSCQQCAGLVNGYAEPHRLGVDRWAAMLGAREIREGALCVIDCGTATTVDVVRADGRHIGGAILPGMFTMRRALGKFTAALFPAEGEILPFSDNTAGAIAGGTGFAAVGAIERLVHEAAVAVGPMTTILTGGESHTLRSLLRAHQGAAARARGHDEEADHCTDYPDSTWVDDPLLVLRGVLVCADAMAAMASQVGVPRSASA